MSHAWMDWKRIGISKPKYSHITKYGIHCTAQQIAFQTILLIVSSIIGTALRNIRELCVFPSCSLDWRSLCSVAYGDMLVLPCLTSTQAHCCLLVCWTVLLCTYGRLLFNPGTCPPNKCMFCCL